MNHTLMYAVSTATYAQMGIAALKKAGFRAYMERDKRGKEGCGFVLVVSGKNAVEIEKALARGGVPVKRL